MPGSFFGIQIGRSALRAHLRALEVLGHNVANASNPAYNRQEALLRANPPYGGGEAFPTLPGLLGTGVTVSEIRRIRDAFLVRQYWQHLAGEARGRADVDLLSRVEGVYQEPSEDGLHQVLARWWDAWYELTGRPEDLTVRQILVERTRTLVDAFRAADRQLAELAAEVASAVAARVEELNGLARRVAELTADIARVEAGGRRANDLRDQRDELLGRMAELAGVEVEEQPGGGIRVRLGGVPLVDGSRARRLVAVPQPGPGVSLQWEDVAVPVRLGGGTLAAYLEFLTATVPGERDGLRRLAQALTDGVNALHQAGKDLDGSPGLNFFVFGGTLDTWDLNPALAADPRRIAASQSGQPGDGSNALAIAEFRHQPAPGLGVPVDDAYRAQVAAVGVRGEEARRRAETAALLREQAWRRVQEVSGVSVDEEMARMVELQHAYAAAARVITAVDELLGVLIERTGLVGR